MGLRARLRAPGPRAGRHWRRGRRSQLPFGPRHQMLARSGDPRSTFEVEVPPENHAPSREEEALGRHLKHCTPGGELRGRTP